MTPRQAKKDLANRMASLGMPFTKLTAHKVSFSEFGYGDAVFVDIDGATFTRGIGTQCFESIPKPSDGGYIPRIGENCKWRDK